MVVPIETKSETDVGTEATQLKYPKSKVWNFQP
jgi:hypothetical protein